ncbi:UDP-glucuronosyl/UDP-glucosyltransferase [Trema orientale]|uniref:UDP-glucuronosyl/UDP-glucosyltransferase n=1 Tax=Trema orientale TaxID=63057 RepID=A0A2P5E5W1_TREOI|nr:UDP-glucuronosyl/UDP-glucosyltransferase [Trema orientale]
MQDSVLLDPVPELQPLRFKDLPISNFPDLDDLMLILETHKTRSSSAIIWNTTECLERTSLVLSQVWGVGIQWENNLERREVEGVIRRLMVNEEGEVIRPRAIKLEENIELSTRQDGSSYNSLNDLVNHILSS